MDERSTHFTIRLRNDRAAKLERLVSLYGGNRSATIAALVDAADIDKLEKNESAAMVYEARGAFGAVPTN